MLSSDHNELQNFVQRLEHCTMFQLQGTLPEHVVMNVGYSSKSQHFFVNKAWCIISGFSPKVLGLQGRIECNGNVAIEVIQ